MWYNTREGQGLTIEKVLRKSTYHMNQKYIEKLLIIWFKNTLKNYLENVLMVGKIQGEEWFVSH